MICEKLDELDKQFIAQLCFEPSGHVLQTNEIGSSRPAVNQLAEPNCAAQGRWLQANERGGFC